jgi:hypothetical protein
MKATSDIYNMRVHTGVYHRAFGCISPLRYFAHVAKEITVLVLALLYITLCIYIYMCVCVCQ